MSASGKRGGGLVGRRDHVDADLGKFLRQPGAVLFGDVRRKRQKNEQPGHG